MLEGLCYTYTVFVMLWKAAPLTFQLLRLVSLVKQERHFPGFYTHGSVKAPGLAAVISSPNILSSHSPHKP